MRWNGIQSRKTFLYYCKERIEGSTLVTLLGWYLRQQANNKDDTASGTGHGSSTQIQNPTLKIRAELTALRYMHCQEYPEYSIVLFHSTDPQLTIFGPSKDKGCSEFKKNMHVVRSGSRNRNTIQHTMLSFIPFLLSLSVLPLEIHLSSSDSDSFLFISETRGTEHNNNTYSAFLRNNS